MNRTIQPEIKKLKDFSVPKPERVILPNGVPLTIINAGEQEVVRMDIIFAGGRWQQSQKLQALFTNRMLREGTQKYSASTIAERLDYYGSWLELSSSSEHAYITIYSLNKYLKETLEVIESMIKEPLFPQKELSTILEANIQQYLVNSSKVDFLAHRCLLEHLYGEKHPCGQLIVENDYRAITPELLNDFYKKHYHSGNCSIFLSGKVTEETIQHVTTILGTSFGEYDLKSPQNTFPFLAANEKRFFVERSEALQSAVKMGSTTITRNHPDYHKLRVLLTLFGGYFGSRLMTNIREDKGYTYSISAGIMFYPDSGLIGISTETDNQYVEPLIHEVYNEIDRLHQEPVSIEELEMVRNYMLGEMCRSYESPFSLSDAWIFIATSELDDSYFYRSFQAVNEITPLEIQDLAQRYLCKETLKEVIAGKKLS